MKMSFSKLAIQGLVAGAAGTAFMSCSTETNTVEVEKIVKDTIKVNVKDTSGMHNSIAQGEVLSTVEDTTMTAARYKSECLAAGKYYEIHAYCSGTNSCKGTSLNGNTIITNTCRGVNTCAGASCLDIPAVKRTGAEVYKEYCATCHSWQTEKFTTILKKSDSTDAILAKKFGGYTTDSALIDITLNGSHGKTASGQDYVNMPSYKGIIHPTEIAGLIAHLKTLQEQYYFYDDQK